MTAPVDTAEVAEPVEVLDETDGEMRVRFPVVVIEGVDTSDGRFLSPGSLSPRALPLSVLAQPASPHGGDDPAAAVVIGRIDTLTRHPGPELTSRRTGQPFAEGTFIWSGEGAIDATHPVAELVRKRYLRGVSVDLAGMDFEVVGEEGFTPDPDNPRRQVVTHSAEIAAVTLVPIPAFGDCYVEIADEEMVPEPITVDELPEGLMASAAPAWRSVELGDATVAAAAPSAKQRDKTQYIGDPESMTAAAEARRRPPLSWFTDPGFDGETPITIDDDGHVCGHVAVWSRAHIGYGGRPIYAQPSRSDYAFFNTGAVRCIDEDGVTRIAAVGHLTVDTSHADLGLSAMGTTRHYDHSGYAWADVAAGDDKWGVWVNGIIKPGLSEERIDLALAHPPSGDWRLIDGHLELVAALCVNTAGVPVPRARVAAGEVVALVAAGALPPAPRGDGAVVLDYDTLANAIAVRLDERDEQRRQAGELSTACASLIEELDDTPAVVAALLAEVDDTPQRVEALLAELDEDVETFDVSQMPPQLQREWLSGGIAARIAWGTPGSFGRCQAIAREKGVPTRQRDGMCANLYKAATGKHPGRHKD